LQTLAVSIAPMKSEHMSDSIDIIMH